MKNLKNRGQILFSLVRRKIKFLASLFAILIISFVLDAYTFSSGYKPVHGVLEGIASGIIIYFLVVFLPDGYREAKDVKEIANSVSSVTSYLIQFEENLKNEAGQTYESERNSNANLKEKGPFAAIWYIPLEEVPKTNAMRMVWPNGQWMIFFHILEDRFQDIRRRVSRLARLAHIHQFQEIDPNLMKDLEEMTYLHEVFGYRFEKEAGYFYYFSQIKNKLEKLSGEMKTKFHVDRY